jgi:hypothetical protein
MQHCGVWHAVRSPKLLFFFWWGGGFDLSVVVDKDEIFHEWLMLV